MRLRELERFRDPSLGRDHDIEIRVGRVSTQLHRQTTMYHSSGRDALRYEEHLGRLGANFSLQMGERIRIVASPLLAASPHVLYTNLVEALLRFVLVSRDRVLLHSACLEIDGKGLMLSARTDTGKTGTVLRLLRERGARFLSDDMTILSPGGQAYSFPKPLTISQHTLRAVDPGDLSALEWGVLRVKGRIHSKEGRGVGMALGRLNLPIMSVNSVTQMLVPPPKYAADRLVACESISTTSVRDLFVIERAQPSLTAIDSEDAIEELLENTDDAYAFPPFSDFAPNLVIDGMTYPDLRERERELLESAMRNVRIWRMGSNSFAWADEIPKVLAQYDEESVIVLPQPRPTPPEIRLDAMAERLA